jgi:hypothetical protein
VFTGIVFALKNKFEKKIMQRPARPARPARQAHRGPAACSRFVSPLSRQL